MSKKLIAAVVITGGLLATVPFYFSGHFAHQALISQLELVRKPYQDAMQFIETDTQSGLYSSSFGYDVTLDLTNPQFAPLKQDIEGDTLTLHIDNQMRHGFLSVSIESVFSGQAKTLFDKAMEKLQLKKADETRPMAQLTTDASFSVTGEYTMNTHFDLQGLTMQNQNDLGELVTMTTQPMQMSGTLAADILSYKANYGDITIGLPDSTITVNQLTANGSATILPPAEQQISAFGDQHFKLNLKSISMIQADKKAEVLSDLIWAFTVTLKDGRGEFNNELSVAKIGNPQMPVTQIEDLVFNFTADMGLKAAKAYYEAAKKLPVSPDDPTAAMKLFANLLSEDINVNLNSIKAKTISGPVDLIGNINIGAVDPAQFSENPMVALQGLKYAISGEIPKGLVMMSGQLPPEFIDNLLQQQMIELKDQQIVFKLTGESGSINLNDKPLM
ncbi:MAG: DUF945 family protein [Algicola sp.]|nr:DUF945 family protein [Algicola sp.]